MKNILIFLLLTAGMARASSVSVPSIASTPVTVSGDAIDVSFSVGWWADDYPQNSAPGRLDLMDSGGTIVARIVVSNYLSGGVSIQVSGSGAVDEVSSSVGRFSPNGTPADGNLTGTWHVTGLAAGSYELRTWSWTTYDSNMAATAVWTDTYVLSVTEPAGPVTPPVISYTLTAGSAGGGSVAGGGSFLSGTAVAVSATPNTGYEFAGWSGDAAGMGNPVTVTVDRDLSVQAHFTAVELALSTSSVGGGNVTPGGTHPFGTWALVSAIPDSAHYFTGWSGHVSGDSPWASVFMDAPKWVHATFAPKGSQAISFAGPGDQIVGAAPTLAATTTSGLPVTFSLVSGPASLNGNILTVTGSGPVTVRAVQAGDTYTLPANPVTITFNAIAAVATVRVQSAARTVLRDGRTTQAASYILGNP